MRQPGTAGSRICQWNSRSPDPPACPETILRKNPTVARRRERVMQVPLTFPFALGGSKL
jgi:hypothetical protein